MSESLPAGTPVRWRRPLGSPREGGGWGYGVIAPEQHSRPYSYDIILRDSGHAIVDSDWIQADPDALAAMTVEEREALLDSPTTDV